MDKGYEGEKIKLFTVEPGFVVLGQINTVRLTWETDRADAVVIEPDLGTVALTGFLDVPAPSVEILYTLIARNKGGETRTQVWVRVATPTPTSTPTPTQTPLPTSTATFTPTPTTTFTPTPTVTFTPTPATTFTPTPTVTFSPTLIPTPSSTPTTLPAETETPASSE